VKSGWRLVLRLAIRVIGIVTITLALGFLIEFFFRPLNSTNFIADLRFVEGIKVHAYVWGAVLSIALTLTYAIGVSMKIAEAETKSQTPPNGWSVAATLLFSPFLGFSVGYSAVTFAVPLLLHQLAPHSISEIVFTIGEFDSSRSCKRSIQISHPEFVERKLCSMYLPEDPDAWVGGEIVLTGARSHTASWSIKMNTFTAGLALRLILLQRFRSS
jgi:hypothetical protein